MSTIYGKYRNIRDAVWKILVSYKIDSLPIKVAHLAKQADIRLIENSRVQQLTDSQLGISLLENQQWYIVFDDTLPLERIRYTIAHELGHIFLGHSLKNAGNGKRIDCKNILLEQEADMFALRLLAPACIIWGLHLQTTEEIAKICGITKNSATLRAKRMRALYRRNKFLISPLEKEVYQQFSTYIKAKKQ